MRRGVSTGLAVLLGFAVATWLAWPERGPVQAQEEHPPQDPEITQTSPPVDEHGEVDWPDESDDVEFKYEIKPRRTWDPSANGGEGAYVVAEEDRVCDIHIFFPMSDGKGGIVPLPKSQFAGSKSGLIAPEGWTAKKDTLRGEGQRSGQSLSFYAEDCETNHIPPEGIEVGIAVRKGSAGWPDAQPVSVALTDDGEKPEDDDDDFPPLGNTPGAVTDSNVIWFEPNPKRPPPDPGDGVSSDPRVTGPYAAVMVDPPDEDLVLATADTLGIEVPRVWDGSAVKVWMSTELDPDDVDPSGTGIMATQYPVPVAWSISALPTVHTFDPGEESTTMSLERLSGSSAPPAGDFYVVIEHFDELTGDRRGVSRPIHFRTISSADDFDGDGYDNEVDGARFDPQEY